MNTGRSSCCCCKSKEKISGDHPDLKLDELDGEDEEDKEKENAMMRQLRR